MGAKVYWDLFVKGDWWEYHVSTHKSEVEEGDALAIKFLKTSDTVSHCFEHIMKEVRNFGLIHVNKFRKGDNIIAGNKQTIHSRR